MKFISLAMNTIINLVDRMNESIGKLVSWLVLAMVVVTFGIVVMRYLFNMGSIQAQESVIYMHALVFMFAAASTLKQDGHVRVDIFYGKMTIKKKAVINLFGNLLLLIPTSLFILWSSWEYVMSAWKINESSAEAGGLPGIYLLKTAILIFASMLILQGIAEIFKSLKTIFTQKNHTNNALAGK